MPDVGVQPSGCPGTLKRELQRLELGVRGDEVPNDIDVIFAALASRVRPLLRRSQRSRSPRLRAFADRREARRRYQLTGRLIGPECRFAKTLPATIPFIDRGPGKGLLAEAIVPDPCFWTPELPFLYRAIVEVYSSRSVVRPFITAAFGSEAQARRERDDYTIDRPFGIRRLGTIGRSLYLDGNRWVARGVCVDQATDDGSPRRPRLLQPALMLPAPDDAFCLEASRLGVPLFVPSHGT